MSCFSKQGEHDMLKKKFETVVCVRDGKHVPIARIELKQDVKDVKNGNRTRRDRVETKPA